MKTLYSAMVVVKLVCLSTKIITHSFKEKALVSGFSEHCEISQSPIDNSMRD